MSKHLEKEMSALKRELLSLAAMVEDMVAKAVRSIEEKNEELANQVILMDEQVDENEVHIEEECLKILALHQPVAIDLRYIIGALKMNNDLERIGDLAVNIAQRVSTINKRPHVKSPFDYQHMSVLTRTMLHRAIDSLIGLDKARAKQVCLEDSKVDDLNRQMYQQVFAAIKETPEHVETLIQYLAVSRNLERIADYSTNIAEDVIYMVEGVIVRHSPDLA